MKEFRIWFTNVTGCAIGETEISWEITVAAENEAEALRIAQDRAVKRNQEAGLPPHGLKLNEGYLRTLGMVLDLPGSESGERHGSGKDELRSE